MLYQDITREVFDKWHNMRPKGDDLELNPDSNNTYLLFTSWINSDTRDGRSTYSVSTYRPKQSRGFSNTRNLGLENLLLLNSFFYLRIL